MARERQSCKELVSPQQIAMNARRPTRTRLTARNGRIGLDDLRSQLPLPDTVDEICAAATAFKLSQEDIFLGANATETAVKRLSNEGRLSNYRVVHFATHGVLRGQLSDATEPGLILTPPGEQTDLDDGYLSASEVATLKLDADWVILSACNTAVSDNDLRDPFSELASAFIYAGARALLVSHWAIGSDAAVKLVTGATKTLSDDIGVGRAEALRRSMLAMIDKGEPYETHPAYWAPFVVLGEGAAYASK